MPYTQAQDVDNKIIHCINKENWFELQEIYTTHKGEIRSPFLHKLSRLFLYHFYNQPDSACMLASDLIDNHMQDLGILLIDVMHGFASNLCKLGNYEEGAKVMNTLCQAIKQNDKIAWDDYKGLEKLYNEYKLLASVGNIMQCSIPQKDIKIPFTYSFHKNKMKFLLVKASINGIEDDFIWDTGAGINVMTHQAVKDFGLKVVEIPNTIVSNHGDANTQLVIVEKLCIGEITFYRVPFYVIDIKTGHVEADSIARDMKVVLGLSLMQRLKEIQFDFKANQIMIPQVLTPKPPTLSNICFNRGGIIDLKLTSGNEPLKMNFDTGAGTTMLYPAYYNKNKEMVEAEGKPDSIRTAGMGGWRQSYSYVIPRFCYSLAGQENCIDSIHVEISSDNASVLDGVFGLDAFKDSHKLIFNLKDMFVDIIPLKKR